MPETKKKVVPLSEKETIITYNDAENYVTKATSLWLVNLPVLHGTGLPKPDNAALFGRMPSGKARTWEDTISRSGKVRSKTFPGIAEAMAEQWGNYIRNGE